MKCIIAGSRNLGFDEILDAFIQFENLDEAITEVVSGTAKGVDSAGEWWATINNKKITQFPAKWDIYGKKAGYLRNKEMAEYADSLLAVWDGKSKGTQHMIDIAKSHGLAVYIYREEN